MSGGTGIGQRFPEEDTSDDRPGGARSSLPELFVCFVRLGLTAFGGPAMLANVRQVVVQKKGWIGEPSFQRGVALCQLIPGATVMQMAAYVGFQLAGIRGALTAFVGFGLPAFLLMLLLSSVYVSARDLWWSISLFKGLQVLVVAVVAHAAWSFGHTIVKNVRAGVIAAGSFILLSVGLNPFAAILLSAGTGLVLFRYQGLTGLPQQGMSSAWTRSGTLILIAPFVWAGLLSIFGDEIFSLAMLMMKIDLFAFGGGFGLLPLMYHEVVEVRGWLDGKTLMDGIALGQMTPGPIVITAAFVGYVMHQTAGAAVATVSVFLPSFVIVVFAAPFFDRISSSPIVQGALRGILASFVGLLVFVTLKFTEAVMWDIAGVLLLVAALIALVRKVDLLLIIIIGASLSIVLFRH
ncbi:MAG TPA: chromate efflux transporter [Dissulfurispiraceae bacterium]|nr:chromate efflux transporter [Dissulfurispiraceae bacterium]